MTVDLHIKGMSMSEKTAVTYPELNTPAGNAPAAQDAGSQIKQLRFFVVTPAKLGEAFLYRWKLAVFVGLCFACVGAAIAWVTYKPKYTASAVVRLTSSKKSLLPGGDEAGRQGREEEFQRTQALVVKQRKLLKPVIENAQIRGLPTVYRQEDPLVWLEKELQAGFFSGTDFFRISLSGEFPEDLEKIVNRVFESYLEQFAELSTKEQADRLLKFDEHIAKSEGNAAGLRNQLKKLTDNFGDPQALTVKQQNIIAKFKRLESEVATLEEDLRKLSSDRDVQQDQLDKLLPPDHLIKKLTDSHPDVQKLHQDVLRAEKRLEDNRLLFVVGSPRLVEIESQLKNVQSQYEKVREAVKPETLVTARELLRRELLSAIADTSNKLKSKGIQRDTVADLAKRAEKEANAIGVGAGDIESLRGQLMQADQMGKELRERKDRLQIEKMTKEDLLRSLKDVSQGAEIPSVNQASLVKTGSIYSLIALAIGLLGISYLEARFHRVHKTTSLHQELGVPTLGVLPLLAKRRAGAYGGPGEGMPGILFTDAVNGICTRLLCDDRLSKNSVLMVTSANEDEGKTTVATQLAMGMARAGRKTLLLDCDFRNPSCEKHLALESSLGIAEVLCGEVELGEALQSIPNSDMKVLGAGEFNSQVTKALNDGRLAALLKRLRKEFDCIIIDSAPTPVVADGLLIGKLVDGVIVVIRAKVSKTPSVVSAIDQLSVLKIPALGSVINANPSGVTSYYL